jgi:ATP-binding cassette, subfamily B, multidrug efflux pump
LEDGAIVEEGTHEELLDKKGIYYKMYMRQLREDES